MTKDLSLVRRKLSGFYEKDFNLKSLNPVSVLNRYIISLFCFTFIINLNLYKQIKNDSVFKLNIFRIKHNLTSISFFNLNFKTYRRNVLEWKTITMASQLSTSQIIKSDDLIGNTLVDVKQVSLTN